MIGTNLPPGTKIICINANPNDFMTPGKSYTGVLKKHLILNKIYTIKEYQLLPQPHPNAGEICVVLNEVVRAAKIIKGFHRARFRRLHLPESLTSLLTTKELETQE